jgi:hypothetical protein
MLNSKDHAATGITGGNLAAQEYRSAPVAEFPEGHGNREEEMDNSHHA